VRSTSRKDAMRGRHQAVVWGSLTTTRLRGSDEVLGTCDVQRKSVCRLSRSVRDIEGLMRGLWSSPYLVHRSTRLELTTVPQDDGPEDRRGWKGLESGESKLLFVLMSLEVVEQGTRGSLYSRRTQT